MLPSLFKQGDQSGDSALPKWNLLLRLVQRNL
jgi:hypothetical protein